MDSDDTTCPAQPTNLKQWKSRARKASDKEFSYICEWADCQQLSNSLSEFNKHINDHKIRYLQFLHQNSKIDEINNNLETILDIGCQWKHCGAVISGTLSAFSLHIYYHTFHQYLKHLGRHIQNLENLSPCVRPSISQNIIPEFPDGLICHWTGCDKSFDNPYIFYSHVTSHCDDLPKSEGSHQSSLSCGWNSCSFSVKTAYKLKEHMRSHTQAKVVACPTCGSLFASNTKYFDHLKRQTQEKGFICKQCSGQFSSERILRDHMRRHLMFHKCDFCDMTCPSPSSLRNHVRYRHSNERLYSCNQCDHRAKNAADLRKHMVSHEHKKNKNDLINQRIRGRHHGEGIYQCHICQKRYAKADSLSAHLQDKHQYTRPSGHRRFRYKLHDDGFRRLEIIRREGSNVSSQIPTASIKFACLEEEKAIQIYKSTTCRSKTQKDFVSISIEIRSAIVQTKQPTTGSNLQSRFATNRRNTKRKKAKFMTSAPDDCQDAECNSSDTSSVSSKSIISFYEEDSSSSDPEYVLSCKENKKCNGIVQTKYDTRGSKRHLRSSTNKTKIKRKQTNPKTEVPCEF